MYLLFNYFKGINFKFAAQLKIFRSLWKRRTSRIFNGGMYIIQPLHILTSTRTIKFFNNNFVFNFIYKIKISFTDYVYFETSSTSPYQIRRIEELNKTPSGNVEAKVMCFYRRRDLPSSLIQLADKHQSEFLIFCFFKLIVLRLKFQYLFKKSKLI